MNTHFNTIELNVTELCNFKCVFCPRSGDYPNLNYHMSIDVVDKVIEDIESWGRHFTIFIAGRGEPTLHKNFSELLFKLIDFRDRTGLIDIGIHTNGAKFDRHYEAMSKVDGMTYNIYDETIDPKGKIEKYKHLSNVKFKDKRTSVTKKRFSSRSGAIDLEDNFKIPDFENTIQYMCEKPFEKIYVDWNGNYNLCCDNWKDLVVLGNIFDEGLEEYATNNETLKSYQDQLLAFERTMHPCSTCDRRFKPSLKNLRLLE